MKEELEILSRSRLDYINQFGIINILQDWNTTFPGVLAVTVWLS